VTERDKIMRAEWHQAFDSYLEHADEAARTAAIALGKRSLASGVPLREMLDTAMSTFVNAAREADGQTQVARVVSAGESFMLDCIAPYDEALSGAAETNHGLRSQADRMEEQLRRIAHEIHDSSAQYLASVHSELHRAISVAPGELVPRLQRVQTILNQVELDLRRFSQELRPTILDDLGLVPALHELSRSVSNHNGLVVVVDGPVDERFSPAIEIALYRTVQESLASAGKRNHAHRVKVKIESRENEIRCSIADDGGDLMSHSSASNRGPGLIGIRERLAALGGTLTCENRPDGHGTQLTASIPLEVSHVTTRLGR
jgi:signal transduction histidine kinase